jgi:hypothetical protein
MVQSVAEDLITFGGKGRDDSQISGISGGEHERGFGFLEACQPGLQPLMDLQVAANQARTSSRSIELLDGCLRRRLDPRVGSKPEIIVAGEVETCWAFPRSINFKDRR